MKLIDNKTCHYEKIVCTRLMFCEKGPLSQENTKRNCKLVKKNTEKPYIIAVLPLQVQPPY